MTPRRNNLSSDEIAALLDGPSQPATDVGPTHALAVLIDAEVQEDLDRIAAGMMLEGIRKDHATRCVALAAGRYCARRMDFMAPPIPEPIEESDDDTTEKTEEAG